MIPGSNIRRIFLALFFLLLTLEMSSCVSKERKKTYINQRIKKINKNRLNCPCGYYKKNFKVIILEVRLRTLNINFAEGDTGGSNYQAIC